MATPEISEIGLKFAAFSSAITDVLASLSCENAVLRHLLVAHGHLSDDEYEQALVSLGRQAWETQKNQVHNNIQELMAAFLNRMTGGGAVQ